MQISAENYVNGANRLVFLYADYNIFISSLPIVVAQSGKIHVSGTVLCWSGVTDTEYTIAGLNEATAYNV